MSRDSRALIAAAVTGVQVGTAIVATRWVVDQTTPISLAMMRYAIGVLCLMPAVLLAGGAATMRIERRDWLPVSLLGIGQFGILIVLLNFGLQTIPSARAALIFATFPLMTLVIAAALGHERMTPLKTVGVLVTLVGVSIVLSERITPAGQLHWLGDAAVAASALVGAVCSVLYRPYLRKYAALPVSAIAMLASVAFLAVMSVVEGSIAVPLHLSGAAWAAVIFIGVISGIGYFLWLYALRHATATRVTIFLALSPLTAALFGALLLDEPMTGRLVAGTAFVIGGLWFGTRAGIPDARNAATGP